MPDKKPALASTVADQLTALGQQIRSQRKALHISATATAEAAGMSRVTLHRIEKGESSVTIGAYFNAMAALGLDFGGVDLLEAEDGPVVCEVNSNAHFAGLLSATGVNPADHIMQYIRRTVCEE